MSNLSAIRKRIKSTKSTQQITKAMKMVAAAKLRGAEERLKAARPYAIMLDNVINNLLHHAPLEGYDLVHGREHVEKIELVVITSDRGLCGGFNSSIIRHVQRELPELESKNQVEMSFVGRKAYEFFNRREKPIRKSYVNLLRDFDFSLAQRVGDELIEHFHSGGADEIYIVYNEFVSAISQRIVTRRLIPVEIPDDPIDDDRERLLDYKYEPGMEAILKDLLPREVNYQLYRAFLESFAAEMGARMNAMENATRNAGEMIDRLTLLYNRSRQAAITVELTEIVNGAEALKG
ncbi:MAG: ATP synthase F1 subunit gamma [Deltaproteobacteria bacterium]|nr:ATP synthase F1 subunit gamma [Deltaproteobacteria bacterium]